MLQTIKNRVSVEQDIHIDAAGAFTVTYNIGEETFTDSVHTDPHGNGLWINGKQIEGACQFSGGKNPREAIAGGIKKQSSVNTR